MRPSSPRADDPKAGGEQERSWQPRQATRMDHASPRAKRRNTGRSAVSDRNASTEQCSKSSSRSSTRESRTVKATGLGREKGVKPRSPSRPASKERQTLGIGCGSKSYFDTIPHERLMERVAEKVADGTVLNLIEGMLQAGVMEHRRRTASDQQRSPQELISSKRTSLSNIYLMDWTRKIARKGP